MIELRKIAYLHTFHSQVAETLCDIDYWLDIIISFDAHVDSYMGVKEILDAYPPDMRVITLRASAHNLIRNAMGVSPIYIKAGIIDFDEEDNPPMYLIIPRKTFLVEVDRMRSNTLPMLKEQGLSPLTEAGLRQHLEESLGINIFESPPKNLTKFFEKNFPSEDFLFDIDVDYFSEFQRECFTPISGAQHKDLGNLPRVLKLIRKYQPDILTISEMKNGALNDSTSRFSKFLERIEELGYEIDDSNIIDEEDTELVSKLIRYEKFFKEVQKPLQVKYFYSPEEEYYIELGEEIKRFFQES